MFSESEWKCEFHLPRAHPSHRTKISHFWWQNYALHRTKYITLLTANPNFSFLTHTPYVDNILNPEYSYHVIHASSSQKLNQKKKSNHTGIWHLLPINVSARWCSLLLAWRNFTAYQRLSSPELEILPYSLQSETFSCSWKSSLGCFTIEKGGYRKRVLPDVVTEGHIGLAALLLLF